MTFSVTAFRCSAIAGDRIYWAEADTWDKAQLIANYLAQHDFGGAPLLDPRRSVAGGWATKSTGVESSKDATP